MHTLNSKKLKISHLKNLRHTFELIKIEVQCSKNCFKNVLAQEAGVFGNNIEKELQKPCPKLKNMCIIYLQRTFALFAIKCKR